MKLLHTTLVAALFLQACTNASTNALRVLDVTLADAPSKTIAEQTISVTGPGPIPFAIDVSNIEMNASYTVQVHIDVDADRTVSDGDFLTVESYPVLTHGHGSVVEVTARRA